MLFEKRIHSCVYWTTYSIVGNGRKAISTIL